MNFMTKDNQKKDNIFLMSDLWLKMECNFN